MRLSRMNRMTCECLEGKGDSENNRRALAGARRSEKANEPMTRWGHHWRRNTNDGSRTRHWISPQLMQSVDAANARQLDVHQNERRVLLMSKAHTLFTGLGLDGLVSLDLERVPHELQVLGVVFDNEVSSFRLGAPVA